MEHFDAAATALVMPAWVPRAWPRPWPPAGTRRARWPTWRPLSPAPTSVFKSVGTALEDLAAAILVHGTTA